MTPGAAAGTVAARMAPTGPLGYRREGGTVLIELRLHSLRQLFESMDPSPFLEQDLDEEAEAYLLAAAREHPLDEPLAIVLHVPDRPDEAELRAGVQQSISNYFGYRGEAARRALREHLRTARASLAIGLAFLGACTAARELLLGLAEHPLVEFLAEGLLIVGWVAMWRPLELALYDWWPLLRRRRLFDKLAAARVDLRLDDRGDTTSDD